MNEFYEGKRILVTGGAGFVGSHLVERLVGLAEKVVVIDNMSRGQNETPGSTHFGIAELDWDGEDVEWINSADSYPLMSQAITRFEPEIIFNLAASVAGVMHNMNHHHDMFAENIGLQTIPVKVAEEFEVPVFVQTSSVCVYDPEFNHPSLEVYGETGSPHESNAGYAWAKRMGEQAIHWSNIDRPVIVRPSNIFGPRDYFDEKAHVVPALIKRAVDNEELVVYGSPEVVRELIYVDDVVDGMLHAGAYGAPYTAYNIGCNGGNTVNMLELATQICKIVGEVDGKERTLNFIEGGGGEMLRWSDGQLASHDLGWRYKIDINDGLKRTVEWYVDQKRS